MVKQDTQHEEGGGGTLTPKNQLNLTANDHQSEFRPSGGVEANNAYQQEIFNQNYYNKFLFQSFFSNANGMANFPPPPFQHPHMFQSPLPQPLPHQLHHHHQQFTPNYPVNERHQFASPNESATAQFTNQLVHGGICAQPTTGLSTVNDDIQSNCDSSNDDDDNENTHNDKNDDDDDDEEEEGCISDQKKRGAESLVNLESTKKRRLGSGIYTNFKILKNIFFCIENYR
jgi:hypothetical protein